ncbi:MAG: 2-dehydropantoate 2-reductase [Lentimonas sp.]|jgi:2-dehydropantoate 2-reductase
MLLPIHESTRCVLVGPGAIGLYYGGLLAKSGIRLHVLARSDYDALRQEGITLRMMGGVDSGNMETIYQVQPESVEREASSIGLADWIIIGAKATANQDLLSALQALVEPEKTILLTLQNGMGNVDFLAQHFPKNPILAGLCFVCANRVAPAIVENYLPGRVEIGSLGDQYPEAVMQAVSAFTDAGIKCKQALVLDAAIWRKLCWNVPFNGLAIAAGGITTDQILASDTLVFRARKLMNELQQAAALEGHEIEDAFLQRQLDVTEKMDAYRPSSLIDFLEGRAVELEAIFGEPLRRGQRLGLKMSELERLYHQVADAVFRRDSQNKT